MPGGRVVKQGLEALARLVEQGWEFRFTATEPGLSSYAAEYEALGYEVHLEPVSADHAFTGQCGPCAGGAPLVALYIRRVG